MSSQALKVTTCSLTYVPMSTCPSTCPLLDNGCMAQHGNLRLHTPKGDPNTAIESEARLIRAMPAYNPLRLRESGDQPDQAGLEKHTAPAARDWTRRGGQPVWTYTHNWRNIDAKAWGTISALASVHSQEEALEAIDAGYAPALVLPEVPTHSIGDERYVHCPQQRPGRSDFKCRDCQLCFKADWLHQEELVIVFTPHGAGKKKILAYYQDQKS